MDFLMNSWGMIIGLIKSFRPADALDVMVVSFVIYNGIKLVRETRAEQLVKGILILLAAWVLSFYLNLHMVGALLNYFFQFSVFALLVVFQPELRRALEQIGRSGLSNSKKGWFFFSGVKDDTELRQKQTRGINAVVEAAVSLQKQKMGALIVFERQTKLGDIADTGTVLNSDPSAQLIGNVFYNKAPLHDGAMIIRDGVVYAAGCILPLTKSDKVSLELGTRHRAAIGISENSDALVVVVSEETGQISIAVNGVLTRNYTRETLRSELENLLIPESPESGEKRSRKIPSIRRAKKDEE
ncbi:diadenylate cyclase CdaA [Clostridium minihomine]|uniref:diadenylate cyclase CdaA n=1 Tax=Clostridium minihomine TaxID=2045012 RepID=UPI000C7726E9|nr:diadenylate cyclase CdaA [Clostridium minihomine]